MGGEYEKLREWLTRAFGSVIISESITLKNGRAVEREVVAGGG